MKFKASNCYRGKKKHKIFVREGMDRENKFLIWVFLKEFISTFKTNDSAICLFIILKKLEIFLFSFMKKKTKNKTKQILDRKFILRIINNWLQRHQFDFFSMS